jgi:NADH-quinone oxidoreductase subunit J
MDPSTIIFYIFAAITILGGAIVVFARRILYAAFALLLTFFGVAGLYVFLSADFLAATQVLIYVGGILVLLLFGVMLTQKISDVKQATVQRVQFVPGLIAAALVLLLLLSVVFRTTWPSALPKDLPGTTKTIGALLMTDYLLPFEVASILLLVALLGAAFIARREEE